MLIAQIAQQGAIALHIHSLYVRTDCEQVKKVARHAGEQTPGSRGKKWRRVAGNKIKPVLSMVAKKARAHKKSLHQKKQNYTNVELS